MSPRLRGYALSPVGVDPEGPSPRSHSNLTGHKKETGRIRSRKKQNRPGSNDL
ncbi:hypothetical protein Aab01nite_17330 [Paractinoplanes abujensis]|nr:hypothetical protein Aab01nite_17330 [Actinoplanes abujensis]